MSPEYIIDLSGCIVWEPDEKDYETIHEQELELQSGD